MKQYIFYFTLIAATFFIITSCSKKPVETEEILPATKKFCSGLFYNYCEGGPIYFNIDALVANCAFPYSLDEYLDDTTTGTLGLSFPLKNQVSPMITDKSNWDFSITLAAVSGYDLDWFTTPISQKPVEVKTISEGGKYPYPHFSNGYEIQISKNKALTLLFFYPFIGGCLHHSMVWEFVEYE